LYINILAIPVTAEVSFLFNGITTALRQTITTPSFRMGQLVSLVVKDRFPYNSYFKQGRMFPGYTAMMEVIVTNPIVKVNKGFIAVTASTGMEIDTTITLKSQLMVLTTLMFLNHLFL
jgi:hypothetical protein